jgi:hypothetical protein
MMQAAFIRRPQGDSENTAFCQMTKEIPACAVIHRGLAERGVETAKRA